MRCSDGRGFRRCVVPVDSLSSLYGGDFGTLIGKPFSPTLPPVDDPVVDPGDTPPDGGGGSDGESPGELYRGRMACRTVETVLCDRCGDAAPAKYLVVVSHGGWCECARGREDFTGRYGYEFEGDSAWAFGPFVVPFNGGTMACTWGLAIDVPQFALKRWYNPFGGESQCAGDEWLVDEWIATGLGEVRVEYIGWSGNDWALVLLINAWVRRVSDSFEKRLAVVHTRISDLQETDCMKRFSGDLANDCIVGLTPGPGSDDEQSAFVGGAYTVEPA